MRDADSYEAWAKQLKTQLEAYKKLRRQVRYFPLFALVTSPVGFFWSRSVAFVICLAWLSLWVTTLYITYMRTWQYRNELAQTYLELERVRAEGNAGSDVPSTAQ